MNLQFLIVSKLVSAVAGLLRKCLVSVAKSNVRESTFRTHFSVRKGFNTLYTMTTDYLLQSDKKDKRYKSSNSTRELNNTLW